MLGEDDVQEKFRASGDLKWGLDCDIQVKWYKRVLSKLVEGTRIKNKNK